MIIHSIVSPDDIFPSQVTAYGESEFVPIRYGFIELDGRHTLKRIISTNPQDYLNKIYQLEKYLP